MDCLPGNPDHAGGMIDLPLGTAAKRWWRGVTISVDTPPSVLRTATSPCRGGISFQLNRSIASGVSDPGTIITGTGSAPASVPEK